MADRRKQAGVISIRPGKMEDAEVIHAALLGIAEAVGDTDKVESTPDDIRRFGFGETPAFAILIAEIDSEFAGMCLYFQIYSSWLGRPGVYVQDLFVDQRFRGLRVGERLLRHVARLSMEAGGVYLRLSVDADNVKAQAFYERLGINFSRDDLVHKIQGESFLQLARTERS